MRLKDSFKSATDNFKHGKMRSALTMLGIVIGIASVIILMSIGQSAQDMILNQVEGVGSNLIIVLPGGRSAANWRPHLLWRALSLRRLYRLTSTP